MYRQIVFIMKKSVVESLRVQIILNSKHKENSKGGISFNIGLSKFDEIFYKAEEMEQEEQDNFAFEFAEWLQYNRENNYTKSIKELLEIFKNK